MVTTSHRSLAALLGMAAGITAFGLVGSAAHASAIASDNAGNYTSGLSTGSTGGYGFGSWTVLASNDVGSPTGPYAGNYYAGPSSTKPIATSGNQWSVYANTGTATATPREDLFRPFNNALASGRTFSAALESDSVGSDVYGYSATNGTPATYHQNGLPAYGFSLQTGSAAAVTAGTTAMSVANPFASPASSASYNAGSFTNPNAVFTFSLTELGPGETLNGQSNPDTTTSGGYVMETNITDATGTHSTLSGLTAAQIGGGVTAAFSLGSGGAYTLTLSSVGATPTVLDTYTGTVSGAINGVDLFDQATASNGYFNSLAITAVPEPATMALFIAAGAGLLLVRRRRAV